MRVGRARDNEFCYLSNRRIEAGPRRMGKTGPAAAREGCPENRRRPTPPRAPREWVARRPDSGTPGGAARHDSRKNRGGPPSPAATGARTPRTL